MVAGMRTAQCLGALHIWSLVMPLTVLAVRVANVCRSDFEHTTCATILVAPNAVTGYHISTRRREVRSIPSG